jgi:hypothetical protein
MANTREQFKWDGGTLTVNTEVLPAKINESISLTVDYAGDYGQGKLKMEAPWHDNTGNARTGLFTATEHIGDDISSEHHLLFSHGVDYGIWLEVANQGKWQIIMPTLVSVGQDLMKGLDGMLNHPGEPMSGIFEPVSQVKPLPYKQKGTSQGTTVRAERQARRTKRVSKREARGAVRTTRNGGRNR